MADPGNVARGAITPTDERLWVAAIAANPADMTVRGVYADWLEEHGRERAASFWRWAAEVGLNPYPFVNNEEVWYARPTFCDAEPDQGDLPGEVFDKLANEDRTPFGGQAYSGSLAAFLDLARAADAFDAHREVAHV